MTALDTVTEPRQELPVAPAATHRKRPTAPLLILLVAAVAFAYSATTMLHAQPTEYGLMAAASPLFLASILLTALGFALAVRMGGLGVAGLGVFLMIVVQRLPMATGTDGPMYPGSTNTSVSSTTSTTNMRSPAVSTSTTPGPVCSG